MSLQSHIEFELSALSHYVLPCFVILEKKSLNVPKLCTARQFSTAGQLGEVLISELIISGK